MDLHDYANLVFAVARWRHFGEQPKEPEELLGRLPDGQAEVIYGQASPKEKNPMVGLRILDPKLEQLTRAIPSIGEWSATADLGSADDQQRWTTVRALLHREESIEGTDAPRVQRLLLVTMATRDANHRRDGVNLEYVLDQEHLPGRLDPRQHRQLAPEPAAG